MQKEGRQNTGAESIPYLRHIKRHLHVTHRPKIVNFIGLHIGNDGDEIGSIAQVTVVEEEFDSGFVTVAVDVVDAARVK